MSACAIRAATRDDAETINDTQNHYVVHSTATFLTEPLTLAQRLAWLDNRSPAHPVIALLEATGFSRVAHFREVGRKFDRWLDVVFLQRLL